MIHNEYIESIDWLLLSSFCVHLLTIMCSPKSLNIKHDLSILVPCTACQFGPAQSCNFKNIKAYETKLFIYNVMLASFIYKQEIHKV